MKGGSCSTEILEDALFSLNLWEENANAALGSVMPGPCAMMSKYLTAGRTFPSPDRSSRVNQYQTVFKSWVSRVQAKFKTLRMFKVFYWALAVAVSPLRCSKGGSFHLLRTEDDYLTQGHAPQRRGRAGDVANEV